MQGLSRAQRAGRVASGSSCCPQLWQHVRRVTPVAKSSSSPPGPEQESKDAKPATPSMAPAPPEPSGSEAALLAALPGEEKSLRLPHEVIDRLKTTVFGFDTFWVTSVENYEENGVMFQGNVRGKDPAQSFTRMRERLKAEVGDTYQLFLLQDKDDKPTVIVLPQGAGSERISRGQEVWLAVAFALGTVVTTLNAGNVPVLQWLVDPFHTLITEQDWSEAVPYVLGTLAILAAHEYGHWEAARRHGASTYLPFFIPAGFGFLGTFGAITRLRGFLPDRNALLEFGAQGPLYGSAASFALLLVGLLLSALGVVDIGVDAPSFADSLIVAVAAQAFLGQELFNPIVQVNSLVLAGWAGLLLNALNCIPMGETDGGRVATALWGRRTGSTLGIWTVAALALSSLNSALSFYWLILVLVLQRGPVLPCSNEMTEPMDKNAIRQGVAVLAVPLLVLLPYPIELIVALRDLASTSYF